MLTSLLGLAVLVEAGVAASLAQDPQQAERLRSILLGLGFTTLLCGLSFSTHLRLADLQRIIVLLTTVWMFTNIHSVITTHRPITSGLLLHLVMLALLAFSWLPIRWAIGTVVMTYTALAWSSTSSSAPDRPGLMLVTFALVLTWYLTRHGQEVQLERVRSAQLRELASTDPLTGLLNRRAGMAQLEALISTWADQPECLSVLMLDLDHFKRINDTLGHGRGDEVLMAVGRVLKEFTRPDDLVVRWGGEEFLVVCSGAHAAVARETGWLLQKAVRQLQLPDGPPLTVSGGLAFLSEVEDGKGLLALADQRLYQAKAAGRDQLI